MIYDAVKSKMMDMVSLCGLARKIYSFNGVDTYTSFDIFKFAPIKQLAADIMYFRI